MEDEGLGKVIIITTTTSSPTNTTSLHGSLSSKGAGETPPPPPAAPGATPTDDDNLVVVPLDNDGSDGNNKTMQGVLGGVEGINKDVPSSEGIGGNSVVMTVSRLFPRFMAVWDAVQTAMARTTTTSPTTTETGTGAITHQAPR